MIKTSNFALLAFIVLFSCVSLKNLQSVDVSAYCPTPDFRPSSFADNLVVSANLIDCTQDRKKHVIDKIKESPQMISAEDVVKILTKIEFCEGHKEVLQTIDPYIFRLTPAQLYNIVKSNDNKRQQLSILEELGDTMTDASQASKDLLISALKCKDGADEILSKIKARDCLLGKTTKYQMIIVDTSGSMETPFKVGTAYFTRLNYVKPVVTKLIDSMEENSFFNFISFSYYAQKWQSDFVKATSNNKSSAKTAISYLRSSGGTNLNEAVLTALNSKESEYSVILITDGYPTEGETNINQILSNIKNANMKREKDGLKAVKVHVNLIMLGVNESASQKTASKEFAEKLAQITGGVFKNYTV